VVEITGKEVRLLVDEADREDEIVEADARAALERAEELKENAKDQVELARAKGMIDRQAVRLKVAELKRRRH
jgi:F0F1-type ATP synthase epsilon subunit